MSKAVHSIWSPEDRRWLAGVVMDPARTPNGTRVEFRASKRTVGANTRLWGLLTFVSKNVEWHGVFLEPEDWKVLFLAKLKRLRIVPNIDGDGFVALGASSSELSRDEFDNLLVSIEEFCANAGLTPPEPREPPGPPRMVEEPPRRRLLAPAIDHREDEFERPEF